MISSIVLISFINACVVSSYIMENAFPRSPRLIEIKLVFNFGIKLSDIMTTPNSVLKDIHHVLSIYLIILYTMKMCIYINYINRNLDISFFNFLNFSCNFSTHI